MTTTIDLAWAWTVISAVAMSVGGILGKKALAELQAHTSIAKNAALMNDFSKLVALAGQAALDELSNVEAHNMTVTVKNTAVDNGIKTAGMQLQAAATALGYTPAVIAQAVSGEVAKAMMPTATVAVAPPLGGVAQAKT